MCGAKAMQPWGHSTLVDYQIFPHQFMQLCHNCANHAKVLCRNHHSWIDKRVQGMGEDTALINCADNRWRHIALTLDSEAAKLPPALTAKEAIDDLPAVVTAGLLLIFSCEISY
jgi:hypothetical protein